MTSQDISKLKKDSVVDYVEEDQIVKISKVSSSSVTKSSTSVTN